jgi:hypothetical protein
MHIDKNLTNEQKLEAMYELTVENHEILRTIRRQYYFSNAFRIFYWLVILGAIGGAYIYVRPLIEVFTNNSHKIESSFSELKNNLPEAMVFSEFMEAVKKARESAPVQP